MTELLIPREEIITRLNRIEGQLRGIGHMVEEERDCIDIITQLAAADSAMKSVAACVLKNFANMCAKRVDNSDIGTEISHAMAIWIGGRS
ncbi:metal-sensitive transcriptional regulator [Chloroflexota bacterium]